MSQDQILCVSYFDQIIGPYIFYSSERLLNTFETPDLGRILEFNDEEGTFIFAYRKYQTINHIFYIDSEIARGGKDLMMISYLIKTAIFKDMIVDVFKYLDSKTPILEDFASKIKELKEISQILHMEKKVNTEEYVLNFANNEFKEQFLNIFNRYFKKLSPKYPFELAMGKKSAIKRVFILGPPNSGKSTFLNNIELIQFLKIKNNNISTRIYEVLIENMEIVKYSVEKNEFKSRNFNNFEDVIKNAEGFIILFDLTERESLDNAEKIFKTIYKNDLNHDLIDLPILIIGNKFDNNELFNEKEIHNIFDIENLKKSGFKMKYYPINIFSDDDKTMDSLRWLVKHML
jgi:hypothetical protein